MAKKAIIVGYFQEVVELCRLCDIEIVGIIDNAIDAASIHSIPVLGKDKDAENIFLKFPKTPLVLTPDSPQLRYKLYTYYKAIGFNFLSLISPNAYVSPSAILEEGVFVQTGVYISSNTKIGTCVRLNVNATIMHDCKIGDFSVIAPNAVLLGSVTVGDFSYMGSNATILPKCIIGDNALVGAGAVVTKNVLLNTVVAGNPSKFLRNNNK
jgi:sugar O-acyltransferase (sialic acid O-acetyltransferase NeuD family)